MSFYSNAGWGAFGSQGATQSANFYGVQGTTPYSQTRYGGGSMQNMGSFYADMQRRGSFYADVAQPTPGPPPSEVPAAPTAAPTTPRAMYTSSNLGSMAYYSEPMYTTDTTTTETVMPVAADEAPTSERNTPTPLQRKNSSGRILRRKVSFSGVPKTLPPEVEPRSLAQTPKRMGSRRLSAAPLSNDNEEEASYDAQQSPPPQLVEDTRQLVFHPPSMYGSGPPPSYPMAMYQQQQQQQQQHQQHHQQQQLGEQFIAEQPEGYPQRQLVPQQSTLATSMTAPHDTRGSFSRRNSTAFPFQGSRRPSAFAPSMQNYTMVPFPRPMYRPVLNLQRHGPYGMYNANGLPFQRPPMPTYF